MTSSPTPFLTATWQNLALLTYEADPLALRQYLPEGVELDAWGDKHLITIVGLQFRDTRVRGVPFPFYRNYPQVNLRFYVRRRRDRQWRRGVVFIKQIVPHQPIALVARWKYREKFIARPMKCLLEIAPGAHHPQRVLYQWRSRSGWNHLKVGFSGKPQLADPGSLEEFVADHYYGYNRRPDGSTLEYRIRRPPWRIWPGETPELKCNVAEVYRVELAECLSGPPLSAFVAEGSAVTVYKSVAI